MKGCLGVGGCWSTFRTFARKSTKYKKLSEDAETKAKSVSFGVGSIIQSILVAAIACIGALLIDIGLTSDNMVFIVLGIIVGVGLSLGALSLFFSAVADMIYQLRMNRRLVGVFALIFVFLGLAGAAVGFIFILM